MAIERIQFEVERTPIVGHFHIPESKDRFPGLIVAGPMTSVKEQVSGIYAEALSRRGFAALAIDHRHFGESGGQPRQYEHYPHKIADIRAGFDWLGRRDDVALGQVYAVGVCLGSGYMAHALAGRTDVRGFAAVAGYYRDVAAMRANDPDGFEARVMQGREARRIYEETGEVRIVPAAALEGDAAMTMPSTFDYYTRRALHPNYRNELAVMSREYFQQFDVQSAATRLGQPFLMLHGANALNPTWADRFFAAVAEPKERAEIVSQGQTDIYDDPLIVESVADRIAAFFMN